MAEISSSSWSETDASNNSASPDGFPEGMAMSGLNNSARQVMGAVKRMWNRLNGGYASTGSANAYVLTPTSTLGAYVVGERYSFRANFANTGSATLNISSLGAVTLKKMTGSGKANLASGDIQSGQPVTVEYDGTDLVLTTPIGAAAPLNQVRLSKVGANLQLDRFGGIHLFINGVNEVVPSAGVTLAPASLSVGTVYYVYAFMSSGTMTMEASTTAPAVDGTYGHKIKNGDATRSLVAMGKIVTGPAWSSLETEVLSWYNRRARTIVTNLTADRTNASTVYGEINAEIRAAFLTWGDAGVTVSAAGYAFNSANFVQSAVSLDGSGTETPVTAAFGTDGGPIAITLTKTGISEGVSHFYTLMTQVNAGTGTWAGANAATRCTLTVTVQG